MAEQRRSSKPIPKHRSPVSGTLPDATGAVSSNLPTGPCPVVGIGASAGGIEAITKFLDHLPPDTGAAFVVLLHSDPHHKSYAVELYARHTPMPITEAAEGMLLEPNHVYVAPAGVHLAIEAGRLRIRPGVPERGHSIDPFLISLAADRQENAVAVILSGSGSDGTVGVRSVKEHGGLTMAQSEGSAQHFEMPGSAIALGLVDVALPAEELPLRLAELLRFEPPAIPPIPTHEGVDAAEVPDPDLAKIIDLLRDRSGNDFALYKPGTIHRRIRRRMQLTGLPSLAGYLSHLKQHADEIDRLGADLLIGVTRFFRDTDAFEHLRSQALDPILDSKDGDHVLRVWVVGCSTGEEAYSIAILISEALAARGKTLDVQIFATDVDAAHLAIARAGVYPVTIESAVSRERLDRFFVRRDEGYQVANSIRELLVFSVHNVLRDAPFSKLDLISCRNVLIYFRAELQRQVLPLFHFALREGGFLFLGPSEGVGEFANLFATADAKHRLFQRRPGVAGGLRGTPVFPVSHREPSATNLGALAKPTAPPNKVTFDHAERVLLDAFAPAAVVVDADANILRFLGRTGRYVEPAPGTPELNLLSMARSGLRAAVRSALREANQHKRAVVTKGVKVGTNGGTQVIDLIVRPLGDPSARPALWLVVFQDVGTEVVAVHPAQGSDEESTAASDHSLVQQLEAELHQTRDDLKSSIEVLQRSNEELRSANEEYLSVNEELQSTVEELETSKEEIQSINEELTTVNAELDSKINQLAAANADINNLLENTRIPTILLDRELRIRAFTSASQSIFSLLSSDVGRPVTDLKLRIDYKSLSDDALTAIRDNKPLVREARALDGPIYEVRLTPYIVSDGKVAGVVMTFIDLSETMKIIGDARRLAAVIRDSNDAITVVDANGLILEWNRGAERLYGYTEAEARTMNISLIIPESRREEAASQFAGLLRGETVESFVSQRVAKDGRMLDVWVTVAPLKNNEGKIVALSTTERDITERNRSAEALRKSYEEMGLQYEERGVQLAEAIDGLNIELAKRVQLEAVLRESQARLSGIINTAADAIITIDHKGTIDSFNPAAERIFGYSASEVIGKNVNMLMPAPFSEEHDTYLSNFMKTGEKKIIGVGREVVGLRKNGETFPLDLAVGAGWAGGGQLFTGIVRDLTARKQMEERLRTSERLSTIGTLAAGLGHDMNNVLLPVRARINALRAEAERGQLSPTHALDVAEISKSVTYLQQLADGLHFLALDPLRKDGAESATNLAAWWGQVGVLISKAVPKHVRVTASFPANLPEVAVSSAGLTQAVLNLVVNAGDAIPADRKRRQGYVRLGAEVNKDAKHIRLTVNDNGSGMSDEVRHRAFDLFFTTKPRGLGTGLGLSLVRKVAEQAGGFAEIESEVGRGTTVTLVLPVVVSAPATEIIRAAISLTDGRAGAMVRHVVESAGIKVDAGSDPSGASIWITEPAAHALGPAEAWCKQRPEGRLVLFGKSDRLSAEKWAALRPIVIEDPDDLGAIRAAIASAADGLSTRGSG